MTRKLLVLAAVAVLPACSGIVPRIDTPLLRQDPAGPARPFAAADTPSLSEAEPVETGLASWYGGRHHGKKTASGEAFDMNALSAAHPSLPLGSTVLVTNLASGRSVRVRINDRFPGRPGVVIDLSSRAAAAIGIAELGRAPVALIPIDS